MPEDGSFIMSEDGSFINYFSPVLDPVVCGFCQKQETLSSLSIQCFKKIHQAGFEEMKMFLRITNSPSGNKVQNG